MALEAIGKDQEIDLESLDEKLGYIFAPREMCYSKDCLRKIQLQLWNIKRLLEDKEMEVAYMAKWADYKT